MIILKLSKIIKIKIKLCRIQDSEQLELNYNNKNFNIQDLKVKINPYVKPLRIITMDHKLTILNKILLR